MISLRTLLSPRLRALLRPSARQAGFPKSYAQHLPSMPLLDSSSPGSPQLGPQQRKAVAGLLSAMSPATEELGVLFARHGHELALVGGPVRDVLLGRPHGDLDLTTDAPPARVLEIVDRWADRT